MINVIAFDFSGVIFTNGLPKAVAKMASKYNLSKEQVTEALNGVFALPYRTGKQTLEEYIIELNKFLAIQLSVKDIEEQFFNAYEIIPETIEIIKKLKKCNYKIAYISDNPKERAAYLDNKYHVFEYFDFGVFSWKEGIRKPDERLYQKLIDIAKVSPHDILYIEDKPDNIIPAEKLGIQTYLFTTPEEFQNNKLNELVT